MHYKENTIHFRLVYCRIRKCKIKENKREKEDKFCNQQSDSRHFPVQAALHQVSRRAPQTPSTMAGTP